MRHFLAEEYGGDVVSLAECKYDDCNADRRGLTDCGALACPTCGVSGATLFVEEDIWPDGHTLCAVIAGRTGLPDRADGPRTLRTGVSFLVATETGMIHHLRQDSPHKVFEPVREDAVCRCMKMTTLKNLHDALGTISTLLWSISEIAHRAVRPSNRMISVT
jgi:hypothetical protein